MGKNNLYQDVQNHTAGGVSPVQIDEDYSDDHSLKHTYDQLNISSTINEKRKGKSNIRIRQEVASVIQAMNPSHPNSTKYSQGCNLSTPFTSINLRMEYIKNNGSKQIEKKRNQK